jgi:hypothetical protein
MAERLDPSPVATNPVVTQATAGSAPASATWSGSCPTPPHHRNPKPESIESIESIESMESDRP